MSKLLLAALVCAALVPAAFAQNTGDFPTKPVTIVTPFAAGSGPDAVLRLVGDKLGALWNQRVIVDNKPGGSGYIASDIARRGAPDGYTLLQSGSEFISLLPHLYKSKNFVPLQHFDPVAAMFRTPFLVAVSSQSPWNSMKDLIAEARAKPGRITYGSWSVGSPAHIAGQQLAMLASLQMNHVPYRDVSQLYTNVSTGEVHWALASFASSQGLYKSGKLKYIAVAAARRMPQLPDVPTMADSGGPAEMEVNSFVALLVPKGAPDAIKKKINLDVAKVIADPQVRARLDALTLETLAWSPEDTVRQSEAMFKIYGELVKRGNISLD
jgi:tripartite-type tricarboxylate transporter receptor subunit TctC